MRESASTDLPVPMIGVVAKGSPWPWLVLHGGLRYLPSVTIDQYSGDAASYAVGADFYVWGPLAIGAAYTGTYFNAEIDDSNWNGSVDLANDGFRALPARRLLIRGRCRRQQLRTAPEVSRGKGRAGPRGRLPDPPSPVPPLFSGHCFAAAPWSERRARARC